MKQWPAQEDEIVYFSDLIDPVAEAIEFAYDLTRKNKGKDVPYTGYEVPSTAGSFGTPEMLQAVHMDYSEDEQGISALQQILGVAFGLGMEQQRRLMLSRHGGEYRSTYSVAAAIEEATEETDNIEQIDLIALDKLRNLEGIEALDKRHSKRVSASLEAHRRAFEALSPEEQAERNALVKKIWDEIEKEDT